MSYGISTLLSPSGSTSQVTTHGSQPSRRHSSRSRTTVPRSRRQFSYGCCDQDGGCVGSRKNGSSSPTGSPLVGVVRPVGSAPGTPRTGSAPGDRDLQDRSRRQAPHAGQYARGEPDQAGPAAVRPALPPAVVIASTPASPASASRAGQIQSRWLRRNTLSPASGMGPVVRHDLGTT